MIRFDERLKIPTWIATIALAGVLSSCNLGASVDVTAPMVVDTTPSSDVLAPTNEPVTATFSEAIDADTLTTTSFSLTTGLIATPIAGEVSYDATTDTAVYTPALALNVSTEYTATLSTDVTDVAGNALSESVSWIFTTGAVAAATDAVPLAGAGEFVLLSKAGISATGSTLITGDIGVSPIALTAVTGFDETLDPGTEAFATSALVVGRIYAANLAPPTPTLMTAAIGAMETAYTDAAGRTMPNATELEDGLIGGLVLAPGLYTWGTAVGISTDLTLNGSANDVWILQIAQDLTLASGVQVLLTGGALPENVFWQVAGEVTLGTTSTLQGVVLSKTAVIMNTGSTLVGRAYAQTSITLNAATVGPN